eukprot:CAMPEP_0197482976 /NCGR_PEP_ID=MMETSP1309-20131121/56646_1 /TAXON_ID=464262 /ORGANISM="Genus nov. species nov., Strain RCC998" /LENGTH=543 /DNA_ID=CAMNT_0043025559 /DNA_START=497 /DNA_END=2128 /DNA_ORIENTATION=-
MFMSYTEGAFCFRKHIGATTCTPTCRHRNRLHSRGPSTNTKSAVGQACQSLTTTTTTTTSAAAGAAGRCFRLRATRPADLSSSGSSGSCLSSLRSLRDKGKRRSQSQLFAGRSKKGLAKTLAVADGVRPSDSDNKDKDNKAEAAAAKPVASNKDKDNKAEAAAAKPVASNKDKDKKGEAAAAKPVASKERKKAKPPKKKKPEKKPWPLSRNTNPVSTTGKTHYNIIETSQWKTGVPTVMGGHMMPSGDVAPVCTSPTTIEDIYDTKTTQFVHPFHYYEDGMEQSKVMVYSSKQSLGDSLVSDVTEAAKEAIKQTGKFTVALSGGSLINLLAGLDASALDWSKVHVFWVDERLTPLESEDSSAGTAKRVFLDKLGLAEGQHYTIDASLPVDQAARAYEGRMLALSGEVLPRNASGLPVLDMVLLGMGPDGHVASLFPNRKELAENPQSWILPVQNSPKPPSERITMTLDILNAAKKVGLVAAGKGKAEIVQRVLEHQSLPGALPAQLVKPTDGSLTWYLDTESASDISPSTWEDKKAWPRNQIE